MVLLRRIPSLLLLRRSFRLLAIESSCDDSCVAVVDERCTVVAETSSSQLSFHNRFGGVDPTEAGRMHRNEMPSLVELCMIDAHVTAADLDYVAVTNEPGITPSLRAGCHEAYRLALEHNTPLLPVHHMRAHATMPLMHNPELAFPYLCLLISGGHCLLVICHSLTKFTIVGRSLDIAPGECLDKCARRLRLTTANPKYKDMSGGASIELLAAEAMQRSPGAHLAFDLPWTVGGGNKCNFSFSGLMSATYVICDKADRPMSEGVMASLCASVQHHILRQLSRRIERAVWMLQGGDAPLAHLLEGRPLTQLAVSGGCASNSYLTDGLRYLAGQLGLECYTPPKHLCNDNALMIAYNAWLHIEADEVDTKIMPREEGEGYVVPVRGKAPIGEDVSDVFDVANCKLKNTVKMNDPSKWMT